MSKKLLSVASYSTLLAINQVQAAVSKAQETHTIEHLIDPLFDNNRDLIPNAVRFGFHSCFAHGCNGCIDFDNHANAGLEDLYGMLNSLYDNDLEDFMAENGNKNDESKMSRGDFWALAAWRATLRAFPSGLDESIGNNYPYKYGRKDCSTSPVADYEQVAFPDERLGVAEILRSFGPDSIFKLSQDECVALIAGGHSIGRAHLDASGYEGVWDDTPYTIDNLFPKELVGDTFTQDENPAKKWQYYNDKFPDRVVSATLNFNTDMSLVKDLELVDKDTETSNGQVTQVCNKINGESTCPNSKLYEKTKYYADSDNEILVTDFARVFNIMLTTVTDDSVLVEAVNDSSFVFSFSVLLLVITQMLF